MDQTLLELDTPETWSSPLVHLLKKNLRLLQDHVGFERDRYARLGTGLSKRELALNTNPFEEARRSLFSRIDACVRGKGLRAYHCTRLTHDELAGMRQDGMHCLGDASTAERLARRVAQGDLTQGSATRLLMRLRSRAIDSPTARVGKIWAVASPRALSDEDGLIQPLRYWGGEAIFVFGDSDCEKLANIGTASIVEFEAPIDRLVFSSLAEDLAARFVHLFAGGDNESGSDLCIAGSIPADKVLNIFTRADPQFERLTGCAEWSVDLT